MTDRERLAAPLEDHEGAGDVWAYDESCVCEDCVCERGRRLSVLMFGWLFRD